MANIQLFEGRYALTLAATQFMAQRMAAAIDARGSALIMLSGGSTPKPIYEALSTQPLTWASVQVGVVDERWVDESDSGSNGAMIKRSLLQNDAAQAQFYPLYTENLNLDDGLVERNQAYSKLRLPIDISVMGMGLDGHTASWFPESDGLENALATDDMVCGVNAAGCPVAGDYPNRITLSLDGVLRSRDILLCLPGIEKLNVFRAAQNAAEIDMPVRALLRAGDRLTVMGCP